MTRDPSSSPAGLPVRRAGHAAPEQLVQRRLAGAAMGEQPVDPSVATAVSEHGGVACVTCTPRETRGAIIHLHGGGYRLGSAGAWRPFGARLAGVTGLTVILPDYSLAPEQPFPAALHDTLGVLEDVLATTAADRVILGGDSAGGGLAMASLAPARRAGMDVAGLALISPWADLTNTAETFKTCAATDALFPHASACEAADLYLQGVDPTDPLASPVFATFPEPPPALLLVSGAEVLLQDSLTLAGRLTHAGGEVELHAFPGQVHDWPVLRPEAEATARALGLYTAFTDRVIPRS